MEERQGPKTGQEDDAVKKALSDLHADEDGRNKEWSDRARVNLETVPEGTRTNLERDFEPENPDTGTEKKVDNDVY
jgi:hypothetical protein